MEKKITVPREYLSAVLVATKMVDRISYLLAQDLSGLKTSSTNNKEILAYVNVRIDPIVGSIHKLVGNLHRTAPSILKDFRQLQQVLKIISATRKEIQVLRVEVNSPLLSSGRGMRFRTGVSDLIRHLEVAEAKTKKAIGIAHDLSQQSERQSI